ncbi:related to 50S ribosomal protein L13 [Armillaria ostoyae]|uniref:Related to 50S ribosomal protein L13 n=1 Tax=Armillaria ostoyae TaxID=47428 RepID=A0A284R1P6_ARMOS|nr:related to 50S ribosomal protein L13 [Armillaria ostoyae]
MSQVVGNTALAYARVWHQVDATDRILGKLAERIALVLMGKHKPIYDPSVDCGDYVIVTNCLKVKVTGRKPEQFLYRKHSMYPGGLKETPYKDMMVKKPEEVRLLLLLFVGGDCSRDYRSFAMLSLGCCPKTNYGNDGWKDYEYFLRTKWASWKRISYAVGKMELFPVTGTRRSLLQGSQGFY